MQFTNAFHVPSDLDTTFATLTDLEKVAPCLPGATLEEVDGDTYTGRVKVKVGPVQVTYRGTAKLTEVDADAKRGRIEASGKETRGTGTASADVTATLSEDDEGTRVEVITDLNITGKPAQFGRGAMAEVGERIIGAFADRLRELLEAEEQPPAGPEAVATGAAQAAAADAEEPRPEPGPEAVATGAAEAATEPRRIEADPTREDDALDLLDMAGGAAAKRAIPAVAGLLALIALIWWWRSR